MEKIEKKKGPKKIENHPASFRDPSGFVFSQNGIIFRQINETYRENYEFLIGSGLYKNLVQSNLLIPHDEVLTKDLLREGGYKIIQPEKIPFISYPYEWSFSQLKDAALLTLEIHRNALDHGMVLKDASAYNIQFKASQPVFIDTLSFERFPEGKPWTAYRQFCQHFLAPLALMSQKDVRLNHLLRVYIDGVPLDLASSLLPLKTIFNFGLLVHLHLHSRAQKRYADKPEKALRLEGKGMDKRALYGMVDNLKSTVRKLDWCPSKTEWSEYYDATNYSDRAMAAKKERVEGYIKRVCPKSVWDLGANTGEFAVLPAAMGIPTVAFDIDPACVELNYRKGREEKRGNLLTLGLDLANPSPGLGWENRERSSFMERGNAELVMALALVHHLAISNNVPLYRLAEFFAKISRYLVIEFVPKTDSQVQRLLALRKDIYEGYDLEGFTSAFQRCFEIEDQFKIPETERTLFLMRRLDKDSA